ncbi:MULTISPECIES: DUF2927 domain-containing protein [unclassified Yoonia]|uniref:DUF2927 domain-containing protein n=1 Tax=unclassified Yoonia TaxID=2629118 RepID=UPI002AFDE6F8|nr:MULTISPECIES: DUF2927 domain-containing protein [unclassified Yoonia]
MKYLILCAGLLLAACAPMPPTGPMAPEEDAIVLDFPPMRSFAASSPGGTLRPNAEITRDFSDLSFRLESGRVLPVFTRFETPVTVRFNGPAPAHIVNDLEGLLARLRAEAGIDIRSTAGADANIVIELVNARQMRQVAPGAACFVVPRVRDWGELRRNRNSPVIDWTTLQMRDRAAVFMPDNSTPQEMRDCLHEELAQALGPLNDLYRLPDSVFNDDNMHAVLTPFDMLILRVTYAPELSSGMSQAEVMALVPRILARLNPAGEGMRGQAPQETTRDWMAAIQVALGGSGASPAARRQEAARAIAIGQARGWSDVRTGFAQYVFGRLQLSNDPGLALGAFTTAIAAYQGDPNLRIHAAQVDVQRAAFALIARDSDAVLALTGPAITVARRHENAALLSLLMMFRAEALDLQGQTEAAMALRLDSLGWGLYGFGSRDQVVDRLNEIASLPRPPS